MIREVDLVSYLPPFMQEYKEPVETLRAENPEFNLLWDAVDKTFYNHFISTADEYGISRFEKILGIYPESTDSLEIRRMRVQNRWFNAVPYTIKALAAKLAECLGGNHNFSISYDFGRGYGMTVVVYSTDDSQVHELKYILSVIVPVNIAVDIIYETVTSVSTVYAGGFLEQADIIEIKQR